MQMVIQPLALRAKRVTGVAVRCSTAAVPPGCHASVAVRAGRGKRAVTLGTGSADAAPSKAASVPIQLDRGTAAALRPGKLQRVTIVVKLTVRRIDEFDPAAAPFRARYRDSIATFARRQGS
jgi:hypothetical protein